MRRSPLWLAAIFLAVACDQPAEPSVATVSGPPALAQDPAERTIIERFDESVTFFDPCFGEEVLFEAHRQIVTFFRGEETHGHFRFNVIEKRSTATGLSTGTVWTLHGTQIVGGNGDFTSPEAPGEFTFLLNHTLTSPGTTVNQRIRERFHVTINPNGTVTVERSSFEVVCD